MDQSVSRPMAKRFAMVRGSYPSPGESALIIANVDGSNEQTLAIRKRPERFSPVFLLVHRGRLTAN